MKLLQFIFTFSVLFYSFVFGEENLKVLYVTNVPGLYHDYKGQRKVFEEIAKGQDWEVEVLSYHHEELATELAKAPDFAKGFDVVVYNFCLAKTDNLEMPYNIIRQTKEHKVNALLIHGSLHSFWPSYSVRPYDKEAKDKLALFQPIGVGEGKVLPEISEKWKKDYPEKEFPVWGDFCGIASERHAKKAPISVTKLREHPSVSGFPSHYETGLSELYLQLYKVDGAEEILDGKVEIKGRVSESPILWELPFGEAKVMCFTLGHFTKEWKDERFQSVLVQSVEYLGGNHASVTSND